MEDPAAPLTDALQEILGADDFGGGVVTNFYAICKYITADGQQAWMTVVRDGQPTMETASLIDWAKRVIDVEVQEELTGAFDFDVDE